MNNEEEEDELLLQALREEYPDAIVEINSTEIQDGVDCMELSFEELDNMEREVVLPVSDSIPIEQEILIVVPGTVPSPSSENTFNQSKGNGDITVEDKIAMDDNEDPDDPDFILPSSEYELMESRANRPSETVSNGNDNSEETASEQITLGRIKRKRDKVAKPEEWKDNKNKKLREQGKSYEGWSKKGPSKKGKRGTERQERKLGPPCSSKTCYNSTLRQCNEITEEERQELFNTFWTQLSWDQKKIYVASLVQKEDPVITRREKPEDSRRQSTLRYTLKTPKGKVIRVCKKLFLSTYDLGEWSVLQWANSNEGGKSHGMTPSRDNMLKERKIKSLRMGVKSTPGKLALENFLQSLPKLPSHYCRQKSSKLYLEPIHGTSDWKSVYSEYINHCKSLSSAPTKPVSRSSFDRIVFQMNLAFQPTKKDRCDKCVMYEMKNLDEISYNNHIEKKNRARKEKEDDKLKGKDGVCTVLSMDVEAVKVCPSLNASALYYKTKLACHNYTIFNICTQDTVCYWFDETQADLTANTFASCLIDFLNDCDLSKPIIVWSDGCTNQNRNSIMSNALLAFSNKKGVSIEQKFLVKGHTQMEVDTAHSLIERKIKDKAIYLPSDYVRLTKEARLNPTPLRTKTLDYQFIKNFGDKNKIVYSSIRPGKKRLDPKVTNIRAIKYGPDSKIQVKINFDEDYKDLPHRPSMDKVPNLSEFQPLHKERLKITKKKWDHLQELKTVIPMDCHSFYDLLPHE